MIKDELKKLWSNKMLLITAIVLCFIPILYAAIFLKGIWDPYGHLDELGVAVVNNDQPVEYNGTTLNVGEQVVDSLKDNDTFDWQFVDADEAEQGMEDNKYYMVITIPEDFSANAATVTSIDPEKMNITYETNGALNYPIETAATTAAKTIKSQVQASVTTAYANSIIATIKSTGDGLQEAADGATELSDGIDQVDSGVDQLASSVPTLTSGVSSLTTGSASLASGVNQLVSSTRTSGTQVKNSLPQLLQLKNGSQQLATSLSNASTTIKSKESKLTSKVSDVTTFMSNASSSVNELSALLSDDNVIYAIAQAKAKEALAAQGVTEDTPGYGQYLSSATTQALPTIQSKLSGVSTMGSQLNTYITYINSLDLSGTLTTVNEQLDAAVAGSQQIADGNATVYDTMSAMSDQLNSESTQTSLTALESGASQLSSGLSTLNSNMPTLTSGVSQLSSGTKQLSTGSKTLASSLQDGATTAKETTLDADQIAEPVELTQEKYSEVKNYGHGLAPYFMSVSLFVGCMMFNYAYPVRKIADKKAKWYQWFASKTFIGIIAATLMALILGSIMQAVGLEVQNVGRYYGILILYANVCMFICMPLVIAFDNPGRFIAMLILITSLGAAGGTFPIETSSSFYQTAHNFVPISYSLVGLRSSIAGGISESSVSNAFGTLAIMLVIGIAAMALATWAVKKIRGNKAHKSQMDGKDDLLDDNYSHMELKKA